MRDSIAHQVIRTARLVERRMEADLRAFGLTRVGWCVLMAVELEGKKNPSDIATCIGIDRTATSRALRQLENEGLIEREMGRDDRRTTEVHLTEHGRDQFKAAFPRYSDSVSYFHTKMSPAELDTLRRLLNKLSADEVE